MLEVARKKEVKGFMEERVARLEVHTEHVRENLARLDETISTVRGEMKESFAALRLEVASLHRGRWVDKVWWLLIGGALLGVMARGFKWL